MAVAGGVKCGCRIVLQFNTIDGRLAESAIVKRYLLSLALISFMALGLVTFNSFNIAPPGDFLELSLKQKNTILLVLAAQALLIAVLTSGAVDRPIAKAATIVAALTVFAAEIGRLEQSIPTGVQVTSVVLTPIGISMTNILPWPKSGVARVATTLGYAVACLVLIALASSTKAGPLLVIMFGEQVVFGIIAVILTLALIIALIAWGLLAGIAGARSNPIVPVSSNQGNRGRSNSRRRNRKGKY